MRFARWDSTRRICRRRPCRPMCRPNLTAGACSCGRPASSRTEAMLCQAASNPPIAMLLSYGGSQPDAYRQAAAQQAGNSAAA